MTDITRNKKILPPVFPSDPVGAEFCRWFWSTNEGWNGWDWICGTPPKPTAKTKWETYKKFPIQPVELWRRFLDPSEAIGVRFKKSCKYLLIDIDRASPNHPANNPADYMMVIYTLRSIGLVGYVETRSTWSCGIHLYFPLPRPVNSFKLACRARLALLREGFKISSGELEIFPNTKSYAQTGFSLFNAHRLPLQPGSGSCLLDDALQPESELVEDLLSAFKSAASLQNMELLESGLKADYNEFKKRRFNRIENSTQKWQCYLESIKAQGWTGQGQTNQILLHLAALARVFLRLSGNELIASVESMAKSAPGYEQYCNHKRDIHQRAKDIAKSAERYYWKLGSEPCREGTYAENFHRESGISKRREPANNITNFKTCFQASERIKQAVATLQKSGSLPDTTRDRMEAVIATAKKSGTGISATTLYKSQNLPLWHPDHYQTTQQGVTTLPEPVSDAPEPSQSKELKLLESAPEALLHPNPIYEGYDGVVMLGAAPTKPAPSIDLKQQGESEGGDVPVENLRSEEVAPIVTARDPLLQTATTNTLDPELSRRIKIRLEANSKAKKAVRMQGLVENKIFTWQERERQETIALMRFLWQSGEPVLMDEVREWALANPDALPEVLPLNRSALSLGAALEDDHADLNADTESIPPESRRCIRALDHHEDSRVFSFVERADYTIHQELSEWSTVAASNASRAIEEDLPLRGRIEANARLILLIQEEALVQAESFRGVRDRSGNLQCVAIVTDTGDHLHLEFIATAPWNITKDSPKSVSEAGTSLMVELVRESFMLGYEGRILLEAVSGSPAFYQRIGFVRTEFSSAAAPEMELTPSAADELLRQYS